ncbi:hypothetical protein [Nocardioides nematodiphilus]|uniref:hypothetical protein n=1 Tax=Nocardioides nematodiphilus TaxID=2849669 RepID=UPI001CD96529|nr:hypothetical protein [Nocardioides nematodiphilus]MCA1981394.1 hypothetical protein [Nocardioides nematodiphilus]
MKIGAALAAGVVGLVVLSGVAQAHAQDGVVTRSGKHIGVSVPLDVTEGTRYSVNVHVPSPKKAVAATLEYQKAGGYSFESVNQWTVLKSMKVKGHGTLRFPMQADTSREYTFRVRVSYRGRKHSALSGARRVNYWHWVGLPSSSYYSVGSGSQYVGFSLAGRSSGGWFQYAGDSAEYRVTMPGRCRSFHALLGLADGSADGATGTITFSAIDSSGIPKAIWKSPTLVPGKTVPVSLSLASPYRFSILGENTSAPVTSGAKTTTPLAQPAVSDPEFLCHVD